MAIFTKSLAYISLLDITEYTLNILPVAESDNSIVSRKQQKQLKPKTFQQQLGSYAKTSFPMGVLVSDFFACCLWSSNFNCVFF